MGKATGGDQHKAAVQRMADAEGAVVFAKACELGLVRT